MAQDQSKGVGEYAVTFSVPGRPRRRKEWVDRARAAALGACGKLLWTDDVAVVVRFDGAAPNSDIDNLLKAVLECLRDSVIKDDRQVAATAAIKLPVDRPDDEGAVIAVERITDPYAAEILVRILLTVLRGERKAQDQASGGR